MEIWNWEGGGGGGGYPIPLEFGGQRVSESDLIFEKEGTGGYYTKVKYPVDPILVRVDPCFRQEQNGNSEVPLVKNVFTQRTKGCNLLLSEGQTQTGVRWGGGGGGCKRRQAKAVGVSFARDVAASSVAVVAALVVVCHRRRRVLSRTMMMALRKKFRANRFLDLVP